MPGGGAAGGLEDTRDNLVDELSKLVDITIREDPSGFIRVLAGGSIALVDNATVNGVGRRVEVVGEAAVSKLTLASTGETITLAGGALKGIEEIRDTRVPEYLASLDTLAATLVSEVNLKHSAGFGLNGVSGTEFFTPTGTTAQTIEVNSAIIDNTDLVAAGTRVHPFRQKP